MVEVVHNMNIRCNAMILKKKPRNPADYPVLGILSQGPAHGYDVCRELREQLGEIWRLRTSHTYALLAGLEKDGLVCHERVDQETRPAKKVFSITEEGRQKFLEWVRAPVASVRDIRLEFLAKLYFARSISPAATTDLVSGQLSVCRSNIRRLTDRKRLCRPDIERAALDFRLAMLHAVEAWLVGLGEPHHHDPGSRFHGPRTSLVKGDPTVSASRTNQEISLCLSHAACFDKLSYLM